jgi:hypothetical protein
MSLVAIVAVIVPGLAEIGDQEPIAKTPKIETTYDRTKDQTTVRMDPMQISGNKGKYHTVHLAPGYSFPGQAPGTPEIIDFELQTVVKARKLRVDLYVLFVIDGEEIFLSSNRWGVKRPVPGRPWVGERLVFRMPYQTLLSLAKAKHASIRMDGMDIELSAAHLRALRAFADTLSKKGSVMFPQIFAQLLQYFGKFFNVSAGAIKVSTAVEVCSPDRCLGQCSLGVFVQCLRHHSN